MIFQGQNILSSIKGQSFNVRSPEGLLKLDLACHPKETMWPISFHHLGRHIVLFVAGMVYKNDLIPEKIICFSNSIQKLGLGSSFLNFSNGSVKVTLQGYNLYYQGYKHGQE